MPLEKLTYRGRIVEVQKTQSGYAVGIDLFDTHNGVFYIFMLEKPEGNYLECYTMFDVPKPESRVVVSTVKNAKTRVMEKEPVATASEKDR